MPTQHDLRRRTVLASRHLDDLGVLQQPLALTERTPRLGADPMRVVERTKLLLRELGVQLDLVDRRRYVRFGEESLQVRDLEVGHADRAHPPVRQQPLEGPPGFDVLVEHRQRPVNEE